MMQMQAITQVTTIRPFSRAILRATPPSRSCRQFTVAAQGKMVKAEWEGAVLAESSSHESVEGNVYFPPGSINKEYFKDSSTTTGCPWKGTAHYYTIEVNGKKNPDAAWYYPDPKPAAANIKDHVAFWKGVKVTK